MIIQELDEKYVSKTHKLIQEIIFTLPSYGKSAGEHQMKAYSVDRLYKNHINNTDRKSIITIDTYTDNVVGFLFGHIEYFDEFKVFYGEWTGVKDSERNKYVMQNMWDYTENFCLDNNIDGFIVDTLTTNTKIHKFLKKNKMNIWAEIKNHWYGYDYLLWGKLYG